MRELKIPEFVMKKNNFIKFEFLKFLDEQIIIFNVNNLLKNRKK